MLASKKLNITLVCLVITSLFFAVGSPAATIHVDDDYTNPVNPACDDRTGAVDDPFCKIQDAIDAATSGVDEVLVHDGTYVENINFNGKAITVRSENGATSTTIDGNQKGVVVTFSSGEGENTVLRGFTIQKGYSDHGGGIEISGSSPTIIGNVFDNNQGSGAAIDGNSSSSTIAKNIFRNNTCDNQYSSGVIIFANYSSLYIVNNILANNPCRAINMTLPAGNQPKVINNTIAKNRTGVRINSFDDLSLHIYRNNIIVENEIGFDSKGVETYNPTWENNLVFNNGIDYDGISDQTGQNGNISEDPMFVDPANGNYHLQVVSPCIDKGISSGAPSDDIDGDSRPQGASYDIGSDEYAISDTLPAAPTNLSVTAVLFNQINLNWIDNSDNEIGFKIERKTTEDGTYSQIAIANPNVTTYQDIGLSSETIYYYRVRAYNNMGNSDYSNEAGIETPNTIITVCSSGCNYSSIQAAIDNAINGHTILVHDGTYIENINFNGKAITVRSENGVASTTIDGNQKGSVVTFSSKEGSNTVLDGFNITNGKAIQGGGIYCHSSSPQITNCSINGNSAGDVGGIYLENSSPTISNCAITDNAAEDECGGIYLSSSSPTINNCTISRNTAGSYGGGIACYLSSPTITDSTINNNTAGHYGGGILCSGGSPIITNSTISGNSAISYDGGGICCWDSSLTITNCTIKNNSANKKGGGLSCNYTPSPTIENCIISGNSANNGSGISCVENSSPTIKNCIIRDNLAIDGGGGIYCSGNNTSPIIEKCVINGNSADGGGGIGCDQNSSPTITHCTISNNTATGIGGGGIGCLGSSPNITHCTISGNKVTAIDGGGAGIGCLDSRPKITNCIIVGNIAMGSDSGAGGISCSSSLATITNCTISKNSAAYGGGIACKGSSYPQIVNSIFWENTAKLSNNEIGDCSVTITYSDIKGGYSGTGNISINPLFVDPASGNYRLQPDSPCIDVGTDDKVTYPDIPDDDIEGTTRPQESGYDMGAYEYICIPSDEVCDGVDNDCNPNTPDGADEPWLNTDCDGNDSDLCKEGFYQCSKGVKICSDTTDDNLEKCDKEDNDCNSATPDGADEIWFDKPCDGNDLDLCEEGSYQCIEGSQQCIEGSQYCSDETADTPESCGNEEIGDGVDNDCDGWIDEGCNPPVFDVGIDLNTDPIEICFTPDQPLMANPIVTLEAGNGTLSNGTETIPPNQELTVPPVADSCSTLQDAFSYCLDYNDETGGEEVKVQIKEAAPFIISENPGSETAGFIIDADCEKATSFCLYMGEGGAASLQDNSCNEVASIDCDPGDLDLSGSGLGAGDCILVRIGDLDPASLPAPPNTMITGICDISLPDGVGIAAEKTVTVTLSFKLMDGSTQSDFVSGAKVFEVYYYDKATGSWKSDGINIIGVIWDTSTTGILSFTTMHLTTFAATSKSTSTNGGTGVSDDGGGGGGGGCSVVSRDQNMSIGSTFVNTIIFLLPLILFRIRRKRNSRNRKE